jgi:hypothetical protein
MYRQHCPLLTRGNDPAPSRRVAGMCIGVMLVWVGAQAGSSQSLADAAARAQEQRKAHPDSPSFTDRDLAASTAPVGNAEALRLELTMPLLQRYSAVRTAILRAMVQSPDLAAQVLGAPGRAGAAGVEGLEREYRNIPAAVDAIRAGHMTVHDYVVTDAAFMIAVGVLAGRLSVPAARAGMIDTNIDFLRRHEQDVAALWQEASALEAKMAQSAPAPSSTHR